MSEFIKKLKQRWGVETFWQVFVILFIFSITGMTSLYVRGFFFELLGVTEQTPIWLKVFLWIVIEIPVYQALFLAFGFLLGQFEFVWRFEKKTIARVKGLFSSN